jgi:hypothetical protein
MRTIALLASILIATSFVPLLQAEEIIKDKSPDKKFALRMTHSEEGWDTAIIETATKKKSDRFGIGRTVGRQRPNCLDV